jgi:hypothetical protein
VSISGDKSQHERTKALSLFKNGSCPLMVCWFILLLLLIITVCCCGSQKICMNWFIVASSVVRFAHRCVGSHEPTSYSRPNELRTSSGSFSDTFVVRFAFFGWVRKKKRAGWEKKVPVGSDFCT